MSQVIEKNEIWVCELCGNVVEVTRVGGGPLVCCGAPMRQAAPNTIDAVQEKHVPVIEKTLGGYLVKIGSEPHPMIPEHHIEWIELMVDGQIVDRAYLPVDGAPEFEFRCELPEGAHIWAREYCNLHGLWIKE